MPFDYTIDFETHFTLDELSHWMRNYCLGEWDLFVGRMVETPEGKLHKQLQIMFENEEDKGQFARHFAIP